MAVNLNVTRPLTAQTESEATNLTGVLIEGTTDWVVDFKATINAAARLVSRLRITPEVNGKSIRYKVELLDFSSSADQTYADARTTPFTDTEADNAASPNVVGTSTFIDADAIHTTAGNPTAS